MPASPGDVLFEELLAQRMGLRLGKFLLIAAGMVLLGAPVALGQNQRVRDTNANGWYMFFGDHRHSDKWGTHTEFQLRRFNVITDPQQAMVRMGGNYYLSDGAMVTLGYAFIETYPYGDFPAADSFPEQRIYQQLQLQGKVSSVALTHRYRLEQRWVKFANTPNYSYLNRARYMLRGVVPFRGNSVDPGEPYLALSDEIFIGFGNNVPNIFDQNRAYAAVGYKINREGALEIGYLHQLVQQRNLRVFEHNHTLQIGLTYNFDFRK